MDTAKRKAELRKDIEKAKAKIARLQERMDRLLDDLAETEAELAELIGYERLDDLGIEY